MNKLLEILKNLNTNLYSNYSSKVHTPYILYTNIHKRFVKADNKIEATITEVQVDYYTDIELDSKVDEIAQALDSAEIPFSYEHMYEADEKVHHHIFDVEVID